MLFCMFFSGRGKQSPRDRIWPFCLQGPPDHHDPGDAREGPSWPTSPLSGRHSGR